MMARRFGVKERYSPMFHHFQCLRGKERDSTHNLIFTVPLLRPLSSALKEEEINTVTIGYCDKSTVINCVLWQFSLWLLLYNIWILWLVIAYCDFCHSPSVSQYPMSKAPWNEIFFLSTPDLYYSDDRRAWWSALYSPSYFSFPPFSPRSTRTLTRPGNGD